MGSELSRRTEISIRTRTGAAIVFERRVEHDGSLPIIVLGSLLSARRWIEAHYTGVQWDSERSGTALVGRLAARLDPAGCRVSTHGRRIAYQTDDFREYVPEIVMDEHGPVVLVRCEELNAESGRWEPFTSIVWSQRSLARDTDRASVRWRHPDHAGFAADMERAGLEVRHYRGRFFWRGPAVVVSDRDEAVRATGVACQWDQMGLDWIVYPQAYATQRTAGQELEGRTIRLIRCDDPHTSLRPGVTGVVTLVDGAGTIHVLWEDGHRLGLIPGIDTWEVADG